MKFRLLGYMLLAVLGSAQSQSDFFPARPPAIPLAVKSPYLSTWLQVGSDEGGNGGLLAQEWPSFWARAPMGWAGIIRVDGTAYSWMGTPGPDPVTQISVEYTSSRSIFTMNVADKIQMNITFLSPIYPHDLGRQSLTFSYLNVDVTGIDGQEHEVQVYSDISAEWVSGDRGAIAGWEYGTTGNVAHHSIHRAEQLAFSEIKDQAEWGITYYATDATPGQTYQSGGHEDVRNAFVSYGVLFGMEDKNYRAINDNFPVFAFAHELGMVDDRGASVLFSVGLLQQQAVQYAGAEGNEELPGLWTSYFHDEHTAVEFFQGDYQHATKASINFDEHISDDALAAAGKDYVTIVSLAARQAFGGAVLTGTPDKPFYFLKEISSNGNMQTVDVVFPTHPIFLYTNPELLKIMLDPLFEHQESGQYPNQYSMHDLGARFPNATGHPDGQDEQMPLEECGNMIIMTLAYAQKSGDTDYLAEHYDILKQWVGFLVEEALIPEEQLSTDDFAGTLANQTNLALKGIIAIEGFAQIAKLTSNDADAQKYTDIAHSYITQWQGLAVAADADPPHTMLSYGDTSSYSLLYNLYADRLLELNLVPQEIYDMQDAFYPTVQAEFGVPLDTRHTYTKGDWEMLVAAVSNTATQDMFVSNLANWLNQTPTNLAFTDLFDTVTGDYAPAVFAARPVVGGTFAKMALGNPMG